MIYIIYLKNNVVGTRAASELEIYARRLELIFGTHAISQSAENHPHPGYADNIISRMTVECPTK